MLTKQRCASLNMSDLIWNRKLNLGGPVIIPEKEHMYLLCKLFFPLSQPCRGKWQKQWIVLSLTWPPLQTGPGVLGGCACPRCCCPSTVLAVPDGDTSISRKLHLYNSVRPSVRPVGPHVVLSLRSALSLSSLQFWWILARMELFISCLL